MKRMIAILAALLIGVVAFDASAQLKIGSTREGAKKLTTLQQMWCWLYEIDGNIYLVSKTTNQFDDWIWLDFGPSKEDAVQTASALIELMENSEKDEETEIESEGKTYVLTYNTMLGTKFFYIHTDERAGMGQITLQSLKKTIEFLSK